MHFKIHSTEHSTRKGSPVSEYVDAILPVYERHHPEMGRTEVYDNVHDIAQRIAHFSPRPEGHDAISRTRSTSTSSPMGHHPPPPLHDSPESSPQGQAEPRSNLDSPEHDTHRSSRRRQETTILKKLHITPGPGELAAETEATDRSPPRTSLTSHPTGIMSVEGRVCTGNVENWKRYD